MNATRFAKTTLIHQVPAQHPRASRPLALVVLLALCGASSQDALLRPWALECGSMVSLGSVSIPTLPTTAPLSLTQARCAASDPGKERRPEDPVWPSLVRVDHRATKQPQGGYAEVYRGQGSAAIVGRRTLLTHGHYALLGDPDLYAEAIVLDLSAGGFSLPLSFDIDECQIVYADSGNLLIAFPRTLPAPLAAPLGNPRRLVPGDDVTIYYWDDAHERFAALQSTILLITANTARVSDPNRVLGPGDSGSPAFDAEGRLIGNLWTVFYQASGARLPDAKIALLPAGIAQIIQ